MHVQGFARAMARRLLQAQGAAASAVAQPLQLSGCHTAANARSLNLGRSMAAPMMWAMAAT